MALIKETSALKIKPPSGVKGNMLRGRSDEDFVLAVLIIGNLIPNSFNRKSYC